jgi:hypothetical protein
VYIETDMRAFEIQPCSVVSKGRTGRLAVARTLRPTKPPRVAVGVWKTEDLPVKLRESDGGEIGDLDPMTSYCS